MADLEEAVDDVAAATGFSGVVRVDRGGQVQLAKAYSWAHRGLRVPRVVVGAGRRPDRAGDPAGGDGAPPERPPTGAMRHGLGFWLHPTGDAVIMDGSDEGVSFRSVHDPATGVTRTVLSNTTAGAWPVVRRLAELLERP